MLARTLEEDDRRRRLDGTQLAGSSSSRSLMLSSILHISFPCHVGHDGVIYVHLMFMVGVGGFLTGTTSNECGSTLKHSGLSRTAFHLPTGLATYPTLPYRRTSPWRLLKARSIQTRRCMSISSFHTTIHRILPSKVPFYLVFCICSYIPNPAFMVHRRLKYLVLYCFSSVYSLELAKTAAFYSDIDIDIDTLLDVSRRGLRGRITDNLIRKKKCLIIICQREN